MSGRERMFTDILAEPGNQTVVEDDVDFNGTKKNLLDTFNKMDLLSMPEHMKVYLRIRPLFSSDFDKNEDQKCFKIENEHTLVTSAPKDSHTFRNFAHGLGKTSHKFKFSKIFPQETTQKEFFDVSMLGLVQNFIDGQNCLVFTYGITSSGKTYTIQGKPRDAGILPRTLDVLFNSIDSKQCNAINHKPIMFMDVRKLTAAQVQEENKIKELVMKMCSDDDHDVMTLLGEDASDMSVVNSTCSESSTVFNPVDNKHKESVDSTSDLFTDLENRVREETAVSVTDQGQIRFSVWVSFAEIYNEQIFDLLEALPTKKNARRPIHCLRDDRNGSPYIKGLKEVCVSNADEAYKLLTVGQRNLRMACTKLNHNSSRSHCIFNIKIIRVIDCQNPHVARVSMLSLCDLAGSERSSKTLATGDRLKEAGNINTSLMTLGRCIDILRYNQLHKEHPKIVPFRESKLTRLFQNFFCGRGKAAMIVNVNQCASMFDETLNVFKFSAIAKQVVVVQKPEPKSKVVRKSSKEAPPAVRPSIPWEAPTPRTLRKMDSELLMVQNVMLPDDDDDLEESDQRMNDLVFTIKELEKRLSDEILSKNKLEAKIRQEVCEEMMRQIVEIEDECSERIREKEIEKEEMRVKLLLSSVNQRKRRRYDDEDDDDDDEMVSSIHLHAEKVKVEECNKKNEELQQQICKLTKDMEKLTQDKTSLQFQLAEVKRTAHKALDESMLRDTITDQERKIKDLTEMLQEAAETFQEKEEEICKLKSASQEDEEKLEQQACALRELRAGLASSNQALEDSKTRLCSKNDRLASLEAQVLLKQDDIDELKRQVEHLERSNVSRKSMELDVFIQTKEKRIGDLDKIIASKDLELEQVKLRLKKEEEDSTQRDQALIHGYTAEINSHKAQLTSFKTKVVGLENKLKKEESIREELNHQIRELKRDLDQTGLTSAERQHSTQISQSTIDDLEKRLEAERASRLETELKLTELSRIDSDRRDVMTAKMQNIPGLQAQIKKLEAMIKSKDDNLVEADFTLEELRAKMESFQDDNNVLKLEHENLMRQVVDKQNEIDAAEENFKKAGSVLKSEIEEKDKRNEQLEKKVEELDVVNAELREMISQTTDVLSSKENDFKELVTKREAELNNKIVCQEKEFKKLSAECEDLRDQLKQQTENLRRAESEVNELKSSLTRRQMECETLSMNNLVLKEKLSSEGQDVHNKFTSQLKSVEDKFSKTINDLQDKMKSREEEFGQKVALKDKELKDLRLKSTSRENEFDEKMASKDKELKEAQLKLTSREDELHSAFNLQQNQLGNILTEKEKDLDDKLAAYDRVVKDLTLMKKETADMEQKWLVTSKELKQLQESFGQEKFERVALKSELDEKSENLAVVKKEAVDVEQKWLVASKELKQLQESFGQEKFERIALKSELDDKSEKCNALKMELSELNSVVEELKTKVKSADSQLSEMTSSMDKKQSESCELVHKCSELKVEVHNLKVKVEQLQEDLAKKEEKICGENRSVIANLEIRCKDLEDSSQALVKELAEKDTIIEKSLKEKEKYSIMFKESENGFKEKMESIKESLLLSNEASERKMSRLQSQLRSKEQEVETFRQTLTAMKSELCNEDATTQKLNCAVIEIAELKSALHMEQTLHSNYKQENTELQKTLEGELKEGEARKKEMETLMNVTVLLRNEAVTLKEQRSVTEREMKEAQQRWNDESQVLEEMRREVDRLKNSSKEDKIKTVSSLHTKLDRVNDDLSMAKETYKTELDRVNGDLLLAKQTSESYKSELDRVNGDLLLAKQTSESYKSELDKLSHTLKSQSGSRSSSSNASQTSHLCSELEIEKKKNDELKVVIEAYHCKEKDAAMPGSSRRLRKEKIELELQLVNARHELGLLRVKPNTDTQLQERLAGLEQQLEGKRSELKMKCDELAVSQKLVLCLQEELAVVCSRRTDKHIAKVPRPTTPSLESFVHSELQTNQEREVKLRQQLKQASGTLMENIEKISELEESLTKKELEILDLDDKLKALQAEKESRCDERQGELHELKAELKRKSEKLEVKSSKVKDLKHSMELERERFEIALKDAKANENMLETLKKFIHEQEETMETQDMMLNSRNEEIQRVRLELEQSKKREEVLIRERDGLQRQIEKQSTHVEQSKKSEDMLTGERDNLQRKIETQSRQMENLKKKEELLTGERDELQRQIEMQSRQMEKLKMKEELLTGERDELQRQVETQSRQMEKLKKKEELLTGERDNLQRKIETLSRQMENLKKKEELLTGERDELQRQTETQSKHAEQLKKREELLMRECDDLQKQAEEQSRRVERSKEREDALGSERDELRRQTEKQSLQYTSLKRQEERQASEHGQSEKQLRARQLQEDVAHKRREETLSAECSRLNGLVDSLTADKDRLNAVLKENNLNIASLEKLLAEKSEEINKQNCSDGHAKTSLNSLKENLKEKSFEVLKLEKQKAELEREMLCLKGQALERDDEMQNWRQNRDVLVGKLESLLKSQAAEIKELKKTLHKLQNVKQEKLELENHVGISLKAKEAIIGDLKTSNGQLQEQVAKLQGMPPTPTFVNDEVDTRGHLNIDATPPSAAKALKKSARKRGHQAEVKAEQEELTEGRPKRKAANAAKNKILTMVTNSPMTRSAAQASENGDVPKKGSKKRQLYKEKISAPFDCAPFMPNLPDSPERVDVHDVVQRQLRARGRSKCQNTIV